ncbi:MAG: DUF5693 family protein [Candidatus Bipolaricaulota bacterium]|nr:DUF5693 family protein [Candidatus Bipolaricaulota bacterium]
MARFVLYGVLTLAILTALWVGVRRASWDATYQTVGLIVPAQELASSLSDDALRDQLRELRAYGVVALSVELADFPNWNLPKANLDDHLLKTIKIAQATGMGIAFIADAEFEEIPNIRPNFVIAVSEPEAAVPPITQAHHALLGIVEFSEPSGLAELYRGGWRNFVRVHAIKSRELERLGLEGALARWERAVQERTIRLLWVTEHQRFSQYLERLSRRITQLGMKLGQPSAPAPFGSFYWVYLAIGAGFVGFALLVLMSLWRLSEVVLLSFGLVGVGALALLGMWDLEWARQALALMIAAGAPWLLLWVGTERFSGWKLLVIVSLGSSCAGLAAAAVLSDLSYFLKINEFRGVKLALVAPSALIVLTELWRWRGLGWRHPLTKRGAWVIPALGLGALFFVLERSGNLPAIPVARWEEFLRERLEDWLTARPRFKEFLVGHPALVLWRRDPRLLQLGWLALGALGQASILNTFVHLHTPLALSLWRTLNGLALGLLIGLTARFAFAGIQQWRRRS